jgi:hypothetical protein
MAWMALRTRFPKCNSIRSRPGWVEPEVYFRIVHVALNGHKGGPVAAYHEQTIKIALGPKGAFENAIAVLRKLADPTAFVCRDGQCVEIPAEEVVPGDVILLQAGSPGPP